MLMLKERKKGLEMLTIIYISGYISHVFKVSQNHKDEEAVGACPKKGRLCCLWQDTGLQRALQEDFDRLSGLKMVLCQPFSTFQLIFKGYVFYWPTIIQGYKIDISICDCHFSFCYCKLYNVLFITAHFRHSKCLYLCLKVSKSRTGARAFSYRAPLLGNQLLVVVQEADTLSTFKNRLKTFLFDKAYS